MDESTVTWNERRKGWIERSSRPGEKRSAPEEKPMPPVAESVAGLAVPAFPAFSPSAVANLLSESRQTVYYWMTAGKLTFFRDNIGEPYVLREELVRFIREYLKRPMDE
jgi:hypothetical protein